MELAENVSPVAYGRNFLRGVLFLEHGDFGTHPTKRPAFQADSSANAQVAADDAGTGVCSGGCLHELLHAVCNHLAVGGVFPVRGAKFADISRSQAGPKPDRHVRRDDIVVPEKRHSVAIHLVHAGLLGDRGRGSIMCDVE
ncbi:UNVERIFIED_CONTAM: hypothetical protein ACS92_07805 [Bacillus cereus]